MDKLEFLKLQTELTIRPMDYLAQAKSGTEFMLIDVRNAPPHLKKEKIQGAIEIPLNNLASCLEELPKDKEIVVYCWDVWCNMAKKASIILLENHFKVRELSGGIAAWKTLGLSTEDLHN